MDTSQSDRDALTPLDLVVNYRRRTVYLPPDFDFYDPTAMGIEEAFDRNKEKHTYISI